MSVNELIIRDRAIVRAEGGAYTHASMRDLIIARLWGIALTVILILAVAALVRSPPSALR